MGNFSATDFVVSTGGYPDFLHGALETATPVAFVNRNNLTSATKLQGF
jgi:hypothetical protein